MKVRVMKRKQLPEGQGEVLGHGHDSFYEESSESFYIPSHRLPLFKRECHVGWRGWDDGGAGYCNYWVVASDCCPLLSEGAVCRLYTDEGREVGKL